MAVKAVKVLHRPEYESEELNHQKRFVINYFRQLVEELSSNKCDDTMFGDKFKRIDPRNIQSAWFGIWWHERAGHWMVGQICMDSDRELILAWYDRQHKPARVFLVGKNWASLRCAKVGH